MGCHTWCYKKTTIDKTDKELQDELLKEFENRLEYAQRELKNPSEEMERFYEWYTQEWREDYVLKMKRIVRFIATHKLSRRTLLKKHCNDIHLYNNDYRYKISEDVVYKGCYHDIFRKYGYPEIVLTTYDEAVEYYFNPANGCLVYDNDPFNKSGMVKAGEKEELDNKVLEAFKDIFQEDGYIEFG